MELINENINYEALEQQVKQSEQDYIKLCVEYKTHFNSYTQLLECGVIRLIPDETRFGISNTGEVEALFMV